MIGLSLRTLVRLGLLSMLPLLSTLTACLPAPTPFAYPTDTPLTQTETPTSTVVWFPPTPTSTLFPTPVLTPTQDMSSPFGEIILTDDFTEPTLWTLGRTATTSAAFGQSELTLALTQPLTQPRGYIYSLRTQPSLNDFHLEITASPSLCRGEDEYGLLLRVSPSLDFYRFSLSCDGRVRLDKYFNGQASSPQPWTLSGAVPPGAPSSSRLEIWARGKEMRFYVNAEYTFTVRDPSLTGGILGVFARSAGDTAVTISFSDLIIHQVTDP